MKKIINANMALLAVGVLQPTNAAEVLGFLETIFSEAGGTPSVEEFQEFLEEQCKALRVVKVTFEGEAYYSLTLLGSHYMPVTLRLKRDKFRAYLLRDAHRARFIESRGVDEGLAGDSPASDTRSGIKGRAPNKLVLPAFGLRFARGRAYWPRIQRQFDSRTGSIRQPRDTFPFMLSFVTREQAQAALPKDFSFDYLGLSACLGISAQLIWKITREPHKHYRKFEVAKKGGGRRTIESPRVFLKVIQWFLSDFVFRDLRVHDAVHSFSFKRSIATNARNHEGQRYVGNVDIENFFGSVTEEKVVQHLQANGFQPFEAVVLSKICTSKGVLPQGAPTSPIISNSIFYDFDSLILEYCGARGLKYTRYADDITISGDDKEKILTAFRFIAINLASRSLKLNATKTRIASYASQQRVTGVVVNSVSAPSRAYRRRVRAMFHQSSKQLTPERARIAQLGGIIGFLKIFPTLAQSRELENYQTILKDLRTRPDS